MTHQCVEEWDIVGVVLKNQEVRDSGRNVAARHRSNRTGNIVECTIDPVLGGALRNALSHPQTTDLLEVRRRDRDRLSLEQLSEWPRSIQILTCRERDSRSLANDGQSLWVVGSNRILEPEEPEWLERPSNAKRIRRGVTPVTVNGYIHVGTDRIANRANQLNHVVEFAVAD